MLLRDIEPGSDFSVPSLGIEHVTLEMINECRARVRIHAGKERVQIRDLSGEVVRDFMADRGRTVSWSPYTEGIVPL